jgi:hypothetical protein
MNLGFLLLGRLCPSIAGGNAIVSMALREWGDFQQIEGFRLEAAQYLASGVGS